MENISVIHKHHIEIASRTTFLKTEIAFLLKILNNCYSTSINIERTKLLDSYWKRFDLSTIALNNVLSRIHTEDKNLVIHDKDIVMDNETLNLKEDPLTTKFNDIEKELRLIKESFYELMQGCNACALKTH